MQHWCNIIGTRAVSVLQMMVKLGRKVMLQGKMQNGVNNPFLVKVLGVSEANIKQGLSKCNAYQRLLAKFNPAMINLIKADAVQGRLQIDLIDMCKFRTL